MQVRILPSALKEFEQKKTKGTKTNGESDQISPSFPLFPSVQSLGPASVRDARQCSKLSDEVRLLGGVMESEISNCKFQISKRATPRGCDGRHSGLLIRRIGFDSQAGYLEFEIRNLSSECGGLHATLRRSRIRFDS